MRQTESTYPTQPSAHPETLSGAEKGAHPVLQRALEAHRGDELAHRRSSPSSRLAPGSGGARTRLVRYSTSFLGEARRAGVTALEVRAALGSGVRTRSWDGCLLVQDWFQGVGLKLDPSGRYGLGVWRTDTGN